MKKYLEETKFAASSLIDLIWADFEHLEGLNDRLKRLTAEFDIREGLNNR
jgi:hypothetical protein